MPSVLKGHKAELQAVDALRRFFDGVPWAENLEVHLQPAAPDGGIDVAVGFTANARRRKIVCEVKSDGQPRHVRNAVNHLKAYEARSPNAASMVVAPYLSEDARRICIDADVGYLDFEGNCRLVFDGVYIDRAVPTRPVVAKRDLRSLFKPKSAQILRALLRKPDHAWKTVELAETAGVSLGHTSNVRKALIDREWALADADGLRLSAANALLDEWRDNYDPPPAIRESYYTTLHGAELERALRNVIHANPDSIMLAGFTAAKFLAPFGRSGTSHVYADDTVAEEIAWELKLSKVAAGGNFVIARLEEGGLFLDRWRVADDIVTTSPVQTYLDLWHLGERGQEAADHLRQEMIPWSI